MSESSQPVQIFSCGPSTRECLCKCSQGGPCEHQWDGEGIEQDLDGGAHMSSATCSRCGMSAIGHSMWVCP